MNLNTSIIVTVTVLSVGLNVGMAYMAEAADAGGMSQSDKSQQPGLPDPGMKQRPTTADPTDRPTMGKSPTGTPGGPGPTAPSSGGGKGGSGSGSSSGGAGGAAGGGGGR